MIDFIFDNIYIFLVIAGVIASWLKGQSEEKAQRKEEEERRRMIQDLEKNPPQPIPQQQRPVSQRPNPIPRTRKKPADPARTITINPPPPLPTQSASQPPSFPQNAADEIERQRELMQKALEHKQAKKQRDQEKREDGYYSRETKKPSREAPTFAGLRSRSGLRRAIILKEILDRPLGLR